MDNEKIYDLAIIGCGPAGLSAAINAKIRNKDLIVFGGDLCSPKLAHAPTVDNYLGFYDVKGEELRDKFVNHAQTMGVPIEKARVDNISPGDGVFTLTVRNDHCQAKTVIVAVGTPNTKFLPGEEKFIGLGVSYCATCDGPLFRDKKVALVAYTDEALEEANFLSEICQQVYFLPLFQGDLTKLNPKLEVITGNPKAIIGDQTVSGIELDIQKTLEVNGVFIIRPTVPPQQLIPGLLLEGNDIKVSRTMETNIPGLYAAGDCTGKPWQLAKSVGEGQTAALQSVKYLDNLH
ncbi:MAG: NAD(P)/FAD-dependent oxidoreductase [Clostridia bacterium]|nr:NAD(P)/FAD-dependent oxidoreductase [Clostridia bacterium]